MIFESRLNLNNLVYLGALRFSIAMVFSFEFKVNIFYFHLPNVLPLTYTMPYLISISCDFSKNYSAI